MICVIHISIILPRRDAVECTLPLDDVKVCVTGLVIVDECSHHGFIGRTSSTLCFGSDMHIMGGGRGACNVPVA